MSRVQTLSFYADGFRLVGSLHLPDRPKPPVVIGCHGLLANRESPKQVRLGALCSDRGIAYFRFDHRGCGESQGRFADVTSLASRCQDVYHAIRFMGSHPCLGRLSGLFGSSFGGAVVLAVSARKQVPAVVTFAAPIHNVPNLPDSLPGMSDHAGKTPDLAEKLKFDLRPHLGAISNILIIHGDQDDTVPVAHAHELFSRCSSPKKLEIQSGGDHPMSSSEHQRQFAESFMGWICGAVERFNETTSLQP